MISQAREHCRRETRPPRGDHDLAPAPPSSRPTVILRPVINRRAALAGVNLLAVLFALTLSLGAAAGPVRADDSAGGIPDRPDKLHYPPLKFTPPDPGAYRVKLAGGIPAYLVPDHTAPLVNIVVVMRAGSDLDPAGKEGLAEMTAALLTRSGTKSMTAEALEERVAYLGAQLESGTGSGRGMFGFGGVPVGSTESRVSLNLLSKDVDEGLALLTSCLRDCAFQSDRVELRRQQDLQDIKRRNDESSSIEEYEWGYLLDGAGHWSNRYPTEASLQSITAADMVAFQHRYYGPKNFVLAVSGDFEKGTMVRKLEAAFARWPVSGENPGPPAAPTEAPRAGWFVADKDVNQTRVSIGLRAIDRYDPDFYAAQVMNFILGGGGFSSRLVNSIRSDEGLAYQVRSSLEGGVYYAGPWRIAYQTKARSTARATELALDELKRIVDQPVSAEELDTAKKSFVEGFPARFPNAQSIAGGLAADEVTGRFQRDPHFLAEYGQRFDAVTSADVQRVARRLLDPAKMTFLFVGNATEMALSDGKHDVTLSKLAGTDLTRVPLRDPLTMKEIAGGGK